MGAQRFEIDFPDTALTDLRDRLARTRWPATPTAAGWEEGTSVPAMQELALAWHDDDWREHETAMNAYQHYRAMLDGQAIHYLHVPRTGELPLLPYLEGLELVVPDLPGYGLSPLARTGIGYLETAELMHALMTEVLDHTR